MKLLPIQNAMVYHIFGNMLQFLGIVVLINSSMYSYVRFVDDVEIFFISLKMIKSNASSEFVFLRFPS